MTEIRDIGYLQWRDPLAWMEKMKGKKWENLLKKEKGRYNELAVQVKKETRQMEKELEYVQSYINTQYKIGEGSIILYFISESRFNWKWAWSKKEKVAYDIDVQANIVWYITSSNNEYVNILICEDSAGKVIWYKPNVSEEIAVIGELCYYIKVSQHFRTVEICVCHARTGTQEKIIYREHDPQRELILVKGAQKTLYFQSIEQLNSRLYKINGLQYKQIEKQSVFQMPLGESVYGDCILIRKSNYHRWQLKGKPIVDWILPKEEPEWINIQSGLVVTMFEGSQTIWHCSNKQPNIVYKIKVGFIEPNRWSTWQETLIQTFCIKTPTEPPYIIHIIHAKVYRDTVTQLRCKPLSCKPFTPLHVHRYHSISKDGTSVPYIVVHQCIKPKAQLIYVYGAYGLTTPIGWPYQTWYPHLTRGWALVFALVRGGGDVDAAWAEMARRNNRHVSVDDFESVIRNSQQKLKLTPKQTVIYGRSAGGIPVGAVVGRFPNGELVGAAFTEVPYVDILQTGTNPDLPLVMEEFDEFGNPNNILNFKELLSVSPVNSLPPHGAPGVFVLSHVGLLDEQVFPYESFKWIHNLRGLSNDTNGKYVTFERNEAHEYRSQKMPRIRAIDFAILDAWVHGNITI